MDYFLIKVVFFSCTRRIIREKGLKGYFDIHLIKLVYPDIGLIQFTNP